MVTFLAGGTGTPKLLWGSSEEFDPAETTVIGNTGDDVFLGGLCVCPDLDTVLYSQADELDRERWWALADDTTETHEEVLERSAAAGFEPGPRYLSPERQTAGRDLARWRRFSAVSEFMLIGDHDRAIHVLRTSLLDEGYSLTEATKRLSRAFSLDVSLLPMSDDPVASMIHTSDGEIHFQDFWVARGGEPEVTDVEFRGAETATTTDEVDEALSEPVVIGPSNPVTSIGPMLAVPGFEEALTEAPVIVVSPFVGERVFSGPAAKLMRAVGEEASTAGVAASYSFADAFVLDEEDDTRPDRPVVRTDTEMSEREDAARVARAVGEALDEVA
jgi:LPPG:FO 2-phospho-L-lactate transferase